MLHYQKASISLVKVNPLIPLQPCSITSQASIALIEDTTMAQEFYILFSSFSILALGFRIKQKVRESYSHLYSINIQFLIVLIF